MAEERKKPKIDLKTRIPSKTVKGLSPVTGGAIPPPPGAVPAPPPDLLGRRSLPPKVSADPNDPLGAAQGAVPSQQQVIVVSAEPGEGVGAASKKGVFFAIILACLAGGLGIGYVIGSGSSDRARASKGKEQAKTLQDKISKTNTALEGFDNDTLKTALSQITNDGAVKPETITAIKDFSTGFSEADLKTLDIAYFGDDLSLKIFTWANKVNHIGVLIAALDKGDALGKANTAIAQYSTPGKQSAFGVFVDKPTTDFPVSMATIVDFGGAVDLKASVKDNKLTTKKGALDVWPGKGDLFSDDKHYVSAILGSDWGNYCPLRKQVVSYTAANIQEIINGIEGGGDEKGMLGAGKDVLDKLKGITSK